MKMQLLDILVCPVCKGILKLNVELQDEDEVIQGSLWCKACSHLHPIKDAIPNLLPPDTRQV